jgi:hypothetical protein
MVIQFNPRATGERASALMMLEKLRDEQARIHAEIERLTSMLDGKLGPSELERARMQNALDHDELRHSAP